MPSTRSALDHVILVKVATAAVVATLARTDARADHQCAVARLCRRPGAAHLSPRAEYRIAQELGRGRRDQPRGAARADRQDRRDGLPVRADRQDLGLLRRVVSRRAVSLSAALRLLRDGKRAVQDFLSGRVSRPDRGRSGDELAQDARRDRDGSSDDIAIVAHPHAGSLHPHHRQARAAAQSRRSRSLRSSTWSRCR